VCDRWQTVCCWRWLLKVVWRHWLPGDVNSSLIQVNISVTSRYVTSRQSLLQPWLTVGRWLTFDVAVPRCDESARSVSSTWVSRRHRVFSRDQYVTDSSYWRHTDVICGPPTTHCVSRRSVLSVCLSVCLYVCLCYVVCLYDCWWVLFGPPLAGRITRYTPSVRSVPTLSRKLKTMHCSDWKGS